ncbi:hypothetical protein [Cyclobacterium xiamenense]|jgi:hypothetical protein|uniref:hypothetical protein n=1 Tax=Cyclobacterium xiamenense TaxID=1297121 RepID=UPI0012B8E6E8|nr:hypothetical protein [Cyclobacterium xiamenense]
MQKRIRWIGFVILMANSFYVNAQYALQDSTSKRFFVGSTFFVLGNFAETNRPDFVQVNSGYRITEKDVVSLELKTWKYAWSLGIPYGASYEAPEEKFPGYIREYGFALVYQRFWWKGLYSGIHVMNAWQRFVDENNQKIDKGFQIFNTYRLGYHIKLFKNRFFIEPSIAITHRLFHTEMPEGFRQQDDKWSKFFYGEPGLHFGFNF